MKKYGICEKTVGETAKSFEINALGGKKTSSCYQTSSSKPNKQDCCRSLSFG